MNNEEYVRQIALRFMRDLGRWPNMFEISAAAGKNKVKYEELSWQCERLSRVSTFTNIIKVRL